MRYRNFSQPDLEHFRQLQRLSFDQLEAIAETLSPGDTERQVARRIRKAFHCIGVHHYFHVPVVLFGKRTGYPGDFGGFEALATDQALKVGMPVILDAAPIIEGHMIDTSLSLAFGNNSKHGTLMAELKPLRQLILDGVLNKDSFREIELNVDRQIVERGSENCHRKHIGAVLGHRLARVSDRFYNRASYRQLGIRQVGWFVVKSFLARKKWHKDSPNWNHFSTSDRPPAPGLWAVEPHFARDGIGVKFEEILVIEQDTAYWLDDDLPHTRYWEGRG